MRPTLPPAMRRSSPIPIRAKPGEWELIDRAAALEGVTRSEFTRTAAVKRAKKLLQDHLLREELRKG